MRLRGSAPQGGGGELLAAGLTEERLGRLDVLGDHPLEREARRRLAERRSAQARTLLGRPAPTLRHEARMLQLAMLHAESYMMTGSRETPPVHNALSATYPDGATRQFTDRQLWWALLDEDSLREPLLV